MGSNLKDLKGVKDLNATFVFDDHRLILEQL